MLRQWNPYQAVWGRQVERLFRHRHVARVAAACFVGLAVLAVALPAHAEEAAPEAAIFGEVALAASPKNVYIESDARIWYTLPTVDKLALVASGNVTYYPVDNDGLNNSQPYDLVLNGGSIWFTMLNANKIGKLDIASGTVNSYPIPTANSQPTGITFGGGYVWFVERAGDKLGRLDPATGTITEYYDWVYDYGVDKNLVDMRGAQLEDVVYLSGNVWFTGPSLRLGGADLYTVATGKWVASPNKSGAAPMQLATDAAGNIWVTFSGLNYIGRSALNTLSVWDSFRLPAGTGGPVGLYVREANGVRELWYTRPEVNRVGRVTTRPSGVTIGTAETVLPTANAAPWGIAVASNGSAWIAAGNAAKSISWNPPYYAFFLRMPFIVCNGGSCVQ